jgi:hypothetical protein
MYNASADFTTKIKESIRQINWSGVINTPTPISFSDDDIISGELTRAISGEKLEIGSVYASQLTLEVNLPNVSRYELYGCTMTLTCSLVGATDVIPMGEFIITEALQSASKISITAFDAMIKLDDVAFSPALNDTVQSPFAWLTAMCTACGVTLGSTSAQIGALPNGRRSTGFADVVADARTWRDVLGYLGAYLGAFSYIGRDGYLYIGLYGSNSVDTVPASFRVTSNLSDFRTTYDGLSAVYKDGGVQEYVSNTNTGGLVLDLGTNPFLQFTDDSNRVSALQEIIDAWNGIYYVPYEAEMPLVPIYDPSDVLTFVDNQAGAYDLGAITEITYKIHDTMRVVCSGDNPRLADAQDRITKSIAGLSADYNNGQEVGNREFWILSTTNTDTMTIGSTETQIAEIEYDQKTFGQSLEMIVTIDTVLSNTAIVNIRVIVDDDTNLEMNVTESKSLNGKRFYQCSNPQKIYGKGVHTCKVYMTVTDSPILWSELK